MSQASDGGSRTDERLSISDDDLHSHLLARMQQRGISREEIERVLNEGREAGDARQGTFGKIMVFPYDGEWEGRVYPEKEIRVYYKRAGSQIILLTAIARYGSAFDQETDDAS